MNTKKIFRGRPVDFDEIKLKFIDGINKLKIELSEEQINKLLDYLKLLHKWNNTYNLTAIRNVDEMLVVHLLDSLSVIPFVKDCKRLLDVGSGGGLPGIVLAISRPDMQVSLVDIVHKKTAFLNQVRIELNLSNVTVYTERVEKLKSENSYDGIISRAFSDIPSFVEATNHLLVDDGKIYAMKGVFPKEELSKLDSCWKVESVNPLNVPYLNAERHIVLISKK